MTAGSLNFPAPWICWLVQRRLRCFSCSWFRGEIPWVQVPSWILRSAWMLDPLWILRSVVSTLLVETPNSDGWTLNGGFVVSNSFVGIDLAKCV